MYTLPASSTSPATSQSFCAAVVQAVRSVLGTASSTIALHEPEFGGREWEFVKDCIDTGWVSSVGSYVDGFERRLEEYTGAAHAVATANGTAALHVCLLLAGVKPGDEVLLPTLTFIATANAVSYAAATPHLVDSEAQSLGVDAGKLDEYLREIAHIQNGLCFNRRSGSIIRALVVMHAFGHPADLESLIEVANKWRLILIEDAAESLGSFFAGRHTGTFGRLAALSFNGNKIVTTGGGGAVLTNDPDLGRRAKHLTTTARVPHRWSFIHDQIGYNYRLPNLNAALGCAQLERLPSMLERKRRLAARYANAFASIEGLRLLVDPPKASSNYWLNALVLDASHQEYRDDLLAVLNDSGYMARPVWTLMHKLPMYSNCPRMDVSTAEQLEARVINLPSSAKLAV